MLRQRVTRMHSKGIADPPNYVAPLAPKGKGKAKGNLAKLPSDPEADQKLKSLRQKKGWDLALAPAKSVPMQVRRRIILGAAKAAHRASCSGCRAIPSRSSAGWPSSPSSRTPSPARSPPTRVRSAIPLACRSLTRCSLSSPSTSCQPKSRLRQVRRRRASGPEGRLCPMPRPAARAGRVQGAHDGPPADARVGLAGVAGPSDSERP
jgi:hypothetical protein